MTLTNLASKLAKIEGKKSQARIGDIRELLGILADLVFDTVGEDIGSSKDPITCLQEAGEKRYKKRKIKNV